MTADKCAQKCPDGTYGNVSDYKCVPCPYFSYNGQCILECPEGTNVEVVDGKTACVACTATAELRTCDDRAVFEMKTTISDDG